MNKRWSKRKMIRIRKRSPSVPDRSLDAHLVYYDWQSDHARDVLERVQEASRGDHYPWMPVPSGRIKKIWQDFSRNGIVTDEDGLDSITQAIAQKIAQIDANTILMGHDTENALIDLYERAGIEYDEDVNDKLGWYLFDPVQKQWILSDSAFEKCDRNNLGELAIQALAETNPTKRIIIVDRILNFVHRRGNFASWVIDGGTEFLDSLSSKVD